MNSLAQLVDTPLARTLGWTLFHSLWEGAMAALIVLGAIWITRSPRARYACACLAMLGLLAAFGITFLRIMPQQAGAPAITGTLPRGVPADASQSPSGGLPLHLADTLPWFTPFWIAGVIVFHLRGAAGWLAVRHLRRRGVCRAPDPWLRRLDGLRASLRLTRPVALLETALAEVPAVAGYLRPVILVPAGLLAGMPPNQMEAILLHELAHIRRHDYLANLIQTAVEGFFFYHPAIWWISNVIRNERENCCDDLVVAASGDAHDYAAALAALEENRWTAHQPVLASTGGSLVKRIHRLLYPSQRPAFVPFFSAAILVLAAAGALVAWQAQSPTPAAPPAGRARIDPYTKWLNQDVVYIITSRERAAFLSLQSNPERDHFIEQFWERRNPTPGNSENAFRNEHYRRLGYASARFAWRGSSGWKTDRGRIYIMYGPPDEIESHPSGQPSNGIDYPFEQWLYHEIHGIGKNIIVEFADKQGTGDYRMTEDPNKDKGTYVPQP